MDSNEIPQPLVPHHHGTSVITGRFGLRAGWGIAIFAVVYFVLASLLGVVAHSANHHLQNTHQSSAPMSGLRADETLVNEGLDLAGVAITTGVICLIERRRIAVYGIGRSRIGDFPPGAFWGFAALSLLIGVLRATHVLVFDARAISGSAIVLYGAAWLTVFLCVGVFEEYFSRGYLQYTLTRGLLGLAERISPVHARAVAFWLAAVMMSIVFGAGHIFNPGETAPGIIAAFTAGLVFSYSLWRTGSLWWAIGFHMTWDWSESFLYGVPDSGILTAGRLFNTHSVGKPLLSGGTTGPEGSIFVIPTFLLVLLIVRFTTRPGVQPSFDPLQTTRSLPPDSASVIT